jgi:hypothetical protein
VIERLFASARRLQEHFELLAKLRLPDEVLEPRRPKTPVEIRFIRLAR